MTVKWLSDDDGPVPMAIVGEADEMSYREGGSHMNPAHVHAHGPLNINK